MIKHSTIIKVKNVNQTDLGENWWVEVNVKKELKEIIERKSMASELGNVVPLLEDLLQDCLSIGQGGLSLALDLHQESPELLGVHLGPSFCILLESFFDVRRRLHLRHLELPREAHAYSVTRAPHFAGNTRLSVSLMISVNRLLQGRNEIGMDQTIWDLEEVKCGMKMKDESLVSVDGGLSFQLLFRAV